MIKVLLSNPRGFCAGVDRAIEIVERALTMHGSPIYVRHEVVHNKFVVYSLRERGAIFVDEVEQVPDDVILIFSAHGVSQAVRQEAEARGASKEELEHLLGTRRAKRGMFEGSLDDGELEIGQVSAGIHTIEPAARIVKQMWQDYISVKQSLCL